MASDHEALIERLAEHLCARRPCGDTPENVSDWLAYSLERCGLALVDRTPKSEGSGQWERRYCKCEVSVPSEGRCLKCYGAMQGEGSDAERVAQALMDADYFRHSPSEAMDAAHVAIATRNSAPVEVGAGSITLKAREIADDFLHELHEWESAYPLSAFPEPDLDVAAELLKAGGMTLDAVSASNMRHVVAQIAPKARAVIEALSAKGGEA